MVVHALQESSQSVTCEVIAALDQEISKLQEELSVIKANEKKARAALAIFEANPRLSDLRWDIQRLEEERDAIQARLADLHSEDPITISQEERDVLEQEWTRWQRDANLRRRMCRDLWGKFAENLPDNMTSQELWVSWSWASEPW